MYIYIYIYIYIYGGLRMREMRGELQGVYASWLLCTKQDQGRIPTHMYRYMYINIYMYMCIERERGLCMREMWRELEGFYASWLLHTKPDQGRIPTHLHIHIYTYIYICTYMYMYMYMYIYIYGGLCMRKMQGELEKSIHRGCSIQSKTKDTSQHLYIYIYIHIYMYIYIYIYICGGLCMREMRAEREEVCTHRDSMQ